MHAYLAIYAVVIAIVRPAIVVTILAGLWVALKRAMLPRQSVATTWLAVAIPLVLWLAVIWTAAAGGAFEVGRSRLPLLPLAIILPLVIGLTFLTRSDRIAAATDAAPPSWLVGLQIYRVLGANFLVLWSFDAIPGVF